MRAPAHTCRIPPAPTRIRRLFCASSQPSVLPWLCVCVFLFASGIAARAPPRADAATHLAVPQECEADAHEQAGRFRSPCFGGAVRACKHAHSSLPIHHPLACPETPPLTACSANTRVELCRFQAQKNTSVERCCVICFALPHRTTTTSTTTTMWRCPTPTLSPTPHRLLCICSSFPSQEILGGPLGFLKCSTQPD